VQVSRIYVRAPNWVGDLVMATASFARLRRGFPDAVIVCGLRRYLRSLLDGSPAFDELIDLPNASEPRRLLAQAAELRRRRCDLAIVFPNSVATGLVPFLARVPARLGYRQGRPGLLNMGLRAPSMSPRRRGVHRVPEPMPGYYARLIDELDLPAGGDHPELVVTDDENQRCDDWLRARGVAPGEPMIVLNAGASYGGSKLWQPDRFAAVARHFKQRGLMPLFLSGPAEVDMVRAVAAEAGALAALDPVLPVGMVKPMVQRAALVVSTDTGPRHVAVAFDRPVVCLIGPNDPRYTNYCLERTALIRKDLDCSPCQRKVCPLGHHDCMRLITTDEVIAAAEDLLERYPE